MQEERKEEENFVNHWSSNDFHRRFTSKHSKLTEHFNESTMTPRLNSFFLESYPVWLMSLYCHFYYILWISPHLQRWHLGLGVEGVEGVCRQEERDPAWQYLEENKVTLTSHANSPDFIHQHYILYIRIQVSSGSDSEVALFTKNFKKVMKTINCLLNWML